MVAAHVPPEALLQLVRSFYVELHHVEPELGAIGLDSRLDDDLGFDSLARIELLLRLEQHFHVHLPEAGTATLERVADLLAALNAAARTPSPGAAAAAANLRTSTAGRVTVLPQPSAASASSPLVERAGPPRDAITLQQVLLWRAAQDASEEDLILLTEQSLATLSYRTLLAQATRIARGLQHEGIGPNATVALMLPTGLEFFFAFFGALLAGAIPVPIYPPARASQLEEHVRRHALILVDAQAQALITFSEAATVSRLLRLRAPSLRCLFSVAELLHNDTGALATPAPRAEAIALLQYTSGSTGSPKGVTLTHRNLLANIQAMGRHIRATPQDVLVSWLPLYHDMGLIGSWLGSLYFGCRFVIMPPIAFLGRPGLWLRAIHDYRGTISGSPNFGFEFAARRAAQPDLEGLDLSCWRVAFNGAEPVMPETIERFQARFGPLGFHREAMTPVYGLAEAAVGVTFPPLGRGPVVDCIGREEFMRSGHALPASPMDPHPLRFVSCGSPLRGYQVRVVDRGQAELPERVEGALQFTGPSATDGYYRNSEATERLRCGVWRDSGDRGYMANGELFLTGRSKDLIIRRGRHIYPEEIEHLVGELPGVRKGCVAVFGSIEPISASEKLIVVAETNALNAQQRGELIRSINQCVIQCVGEPPEEIVLAPPHSVLKTSSGKLRRAATRASYEQGTLQRPSTRARQLRQLALQSIGPLMRRGIQNIMRVAYGLYAWSVFVAVGVPVTILAALALNRERAWRLTHHAALGLIRAWCIRPSIPWPGAAKLPSPHVIVANHCSYVDSLFLVALLRSPHRFVASFGWQNLPLLHGYFRALGTVLLPRSSARDSAAELQRLKDALADGSSLVVFPEGTFTRAPGVQRFRLGAFEAAVDTHVPVIAVALTGTRSLLRDGQYLPRRTTVEMVISEPYNVPTGTDAFTAAVQLRDAARAHILRYSREPELA
jgi:1-acyl-sn-glycerol-3-phosphate acyltransferase